jgi:purine-nucleoside phosphorylase
LNADPVASMREVEEAVRVVQDSVASRPRMGVVLGSGLGAFADSLAELQKLPYASLPHFASIGVSGHAGNLCFGRIGALEIACLQGRVHAYEGHPVARVVFGVRVLAALGCRAVLLTNAAGGIRADLGPGDLMLITDHLNLTGHNPLLGPVRTGGTRFPDMTTAYAPELGACARAAAAELNLDLKSGIYAGVLGPSYETPAEIRMLRTLGADAVGMSTVLEMIALRELGVRASAVSVITNQAAGLSGEPLSHAEVEAAATRVRRVFIEFLGRWVTLSDVELDRDE